MTRLKSILSLFFVVCLSFAGAITAQCKVVYVRTDGSTTADGSTWELARKTIAGGLAVAVAGDEIWVAQGTYTERITLKSGVAVYGGFAGTETSRDERNWASNKTIIDAAKNGGVVSITNAVASTTIDGFVIRNGSNSSGGGIYCSSSSPTISNNVIVSNTASSTGVIYTTSSSPTIVNNSIIGNSGSGIYCVNGSPVITNNTIAFNSSSTNGGGIYWAGSSTISIANNIVAFNSSGIYRSSAAPILKCNCVFGNISYDYYGMSAGAGDLSANPMLTISAEGLAHIQPNSPCRNAADSSVQSLPSRDIDGQARPEGGAVDIGADETYGETLLAPTIHVTPTGDDTNDGLSWNKPKKTVQAAVDSCISGNEIWVAAGTYVERIWLKSGVAMYGGFAGNELSRDERNWAVNTTILDANRAGTVVDSRFGAPFSTRVDGFTIRNAISGGIYCSNSSLTISNNIISGNSSSGGIFNGGGVECKGGAPRIVNNTFIGNTSTYGGAIYCQLSNPSIVNNTIISNTATSDGGGIYLAGSSPSICNNIIAYNSSGIFQSTGTPLVRNNCVFGNKSYSYSGLSAGTGDISLDPLLVASRGPWHIQPNSPCLNAGYDSASGIPATDCDGQARYEGSAIDIGADESYGESWGPCIVYVSPKGDDNNDGFSWVTAKKTIAAGLSTASATMEVWVAAGTYKERITLKTGVGLYGGFVGTETARDDRSWTANQTVIDGNLSGAVVTAPSGATKSTIIDGFVIRNGKATSYGGGIYCASSSPTISNNTITRNTAPNGGGGIYCLMSSPMILNNSIVSNSDGGGIYCTGGSPVISNNSVTYNASSDSNAGGIFCSSSSAVISNNIVFGNSSGIYQSGGGPILRCNCVYGNTSFNYSGLTPGTGDISVDPMVVISAGGIAHIQPGSPCKDAGDNSVTGLPLDADGQARPNGDKVDIGMDESYGETRSQRVIHVTPNGNDDSDGLSWESAKKTVQAGIEACAPNDEVWVAAGTYRECISLRNGVALYGGFVGIETARDERNWRANPTVIDGNKGGSVVTASLVNAASTIIDGFTIRNGMTSTYGGGIYCSASALTISDNIVTANNSDTGGGIYVTGGSPNIQTNIITGNNSGDGAGIYCTGSSALIYNNTITGNIGRDLRDGGGICCISSNPVISNNIVAFNSSGVYSANGTPALRSNCVYGNRYYNYSGLTPGVQDISADPLLATSTAGVVHIQPNSPCRNAGDNTVVGVHTTDIDGQSRLEDGLVDIGADESHAEIWEHSSIFVSTTGNDNNDGSSWALAKKTVSEGLNASLPGMEIWVAAGTYAERITLKNGVLLYGGFAGTETLVGQRNWTVNPTILDGNQGGAVVTSYSSAQQSTTIDGFTIRNGKASAYGGGIYCGMSSPTIANNSIVSNEGGGIYCSGSSSPAILNNIMASNTGGGIYCGGGSPKISNNTITGNKASDGGGIKSYGSPVCSNNIIAFNSSGIYASGGAPALTNNCIYGNTSYDYSGASAGATDISADPLFVDSAGGDYRLKPSSPCINAGWNAAQYLPATDIDGRSRIIGGVVDIGAHEYMPSGDMTSIFGAKKAALYSWIEFTGGAVTAKLGDAFYIENEKRTSGIRVEKVGHLLDRSMKAHVFGQVKTNADGEVYIEASLAERSGAETAFVAPFALGNNSLGGGSFGLQQGIAGASGLNNIGLLVRTWGKVVEIEPVTAPAVPKWFKLDDGSGKSVKCVVPSGVTIDSAWKYVIVTGVSSCEMDGLGLHRLLRLQDQSDITVVR